MALEAFTNVFAGNPLNRVSDRRGDQAWLAEQLASPDALAVAIWNGRPLVQKTDGGLEIAYIAGRMAGELAGGTEKLLFLGLWKETPVFAVDLDDLADPAEGGALAGLGEFRDMRAAAPKLPGPEAAIAGTARQMFEWRRRHKHCPGCGEHTHAFDGGWKRKCEACNTEHFPRTDPVVIMLPYHGDRCMLGRGATWPAGMFSALAGFLEPGESIEEACARELFEEAGLKTAKVHYHSTQPWPFPSSLMIGLLAEVEDDQAAPDQTELAEVRWFSREEATSLLSGQVEGVTTPQAMAIAHQLIKAWTEL